jgi:hypothetical protein
MKKSKQKADNQEIFNRLSAFCLHYSNKFQRNAICGIPDTIFFVGFSFSDIVVHKFFDKKRINYENRKVLVKESFNDWVMIMAGRFQGDFSVFLLRMNQV